MGVSGGYCYKCVITGIEKGERGRAGELKGSILREQKLGVVLQNSAIGLIGRFGEKSVYDSRKKLAVSQPEVGGAEIYATLNGLEPSMYSVSIVKVDKNDKNNKNMVIKITDERLIEIAGGLIGRFGEKSVYDSRKKLAVSQPEVGGAEIYATLNGLEPSMYSVSIVKVDKNDKNNKNMVIKITDERLIEIAGGIVQGMSGSPIVQNGKIIGAVTHVFLNDATRGYAIAIDKMLAVG